MSPADRRARNRDHMRRRRQGEPRRCTRCGLPVTAPRQRVHATCRPRVAARALLIDFAEWEPVPLARAFAYSGA